MVTSIVRQSVIIKCKQKISAMLGNYEFYYSVGFLNKKYDLGCNSQMKPVEIKEKIASKLEAIEGDSPEEEYLITILKKYRPSDEYNDDMVEVFEMGVNEQKPWSVKL
ncbi:DUF3837 family protein [Lachnobacterium bovis]|uniref:DUF3837 family protein n=1 Tax=Lachnobacterium bovis TaxID=140626 RepID=UPI0003B75367|nr:DUF3837 family protein [Lachnobacterium bovis]